MYNFIRICISESATFILNSLFRNKVILQNSFFLIALRLNHLHVLWSSIKILYFLLGIYCALNTCIYFQKNNNSTHHVIKVVQQLLHYS
jgi:hypothetical protein